MKKLFKKDFGEEHNFWMSYTDLMSECYSLQSL